MRVNKLEQIKQQQIDEGVVPKGPAVVKPSSSGKLPTLELMQSMMANDLNKMKQVKTMDAKNNIKRTVLPEYLPFVTDYMESGHDYPNDVAVQVMIWLFDVEDIEDALNLALYLIFQRNQVMPERFSRRDLETFVCDAMYDWASNALKADHGASPYLDNLVDALRSGDWGLHEAVESKCYAMLAKHKVRSGDDKYAFELCEWAELANPVGAGVKTLKKQIEARLAKTDTTTE